MANNPFLYPVEKGVSFDVDIERMVLERKLKCNFKL